MKPRVLFSVSILAVAGVFAQTNTALAQQPASVLIKPTGKLVGSGEAAVVRLRSSCEPPFEVLEANLSLSQGPFISGFAGTTGFPCDGKVHKERVTVPADEGTTFHAGAAFASAFLLVIDPATDETEQDQATRTIRLR
jgi:hypothetical protein